MLAEAALADVAFDPATFCHEVAFTAVDLGDGVHPGADFERHSDGRWYSRARADPRRPPADTHVI
jgi:hypothetical protein